MSESIKSGQQYHITNEENGLSFYLYLDDKVVVGWGFRDEERQRVSRLPSSIAHHPSYTTAITFQWIIERQNDSQWTIQSVKFQKYLGFENVPKDGSPVVCLDKPPHLWDIEIQPDCEEDDYTRVKYVFLSRTAMARS